MWTSRGAPARLRADRLGPLASRDDGDADIVADRTPGTASTAPIRRSKRPIVLSGSLADGVGSISKDEQVAWIEPDIDLAVVVERADEEPGDDEQDQARGNLHADQRPRHQGPLPPCARGFLEPGHRADARRAQRVTDAEHERGDRRESAGERQRAEVDRGREDDIVLEHPRQRVLCPRGECQTGSRACRRQQQAFRSSCRISRARLAPSASLTVISWRRFAARTSSRLATLTHAISRTTPVTANRNVRLRARHRRRTVGTLTPGHDAHDRHPAPPRVARLRRRALQLVTTVSLKIGWSSASTCSLVTPGFSRPMSRSHQLDIERGLPVGDSRSDIASGQAQIDRLGHFRAVKVSGVTPTMVNVVRFTRIVLPMMAGSPRNRRCQ